MDLNSFKLKDQLHKSFENIVVDRVIKENVIPISNNLFSKAKVTISELLNKKFKSNDIENINIPATSTESTSKSDSNFEINKVTISETEKNLSVSKKNTSLDSISINVDDLKVDTSNLNVDTSKLNINTDDLKIDMSIFDKKD